MKLITQRALKSATLSLLFLISAHNALAQNVVVSGAVAGNGSYPDLTSAFNAINGAAHPGANIHVNIIGNTTESASAILNAGAWTSLSITPSGGALRTITGNVAGPLIDFNGADNVTIDGLNSGGDALSLVNTNTATALTNTLRFKDGATYNTILKCTVLGSSSSVTLGTIAFYTSSFVGNSYNTIASCTISSAGANCPANAVLSAGSALAINTHNTIQNCIISDYFNAGLATCGILVGANNSDWTISNNKFFQSAHRSFTATTLHRAILVSSGVAHTILSNTIGYASASAAGSYSMTGASIRFVGIELSATVGGAASSVQGNTVTAISLNTGGATATGNGVVCGIGVLTGNVNITENLIGGISGADLIMSNQTSNGGMVVGINSSSTGSITIQTNTLGGLTATGLTASLAGDVVGINIAGVAASLNISNNIIGNATANNMRAGTSGLTTIATSVSGISLVPIMTGQVIVTNNKVTNFTAWSTATSAFLRGIWTNATSGTGSYSVTSNVVTNLSSSSALATVTDGKGGAVGICISAGVNNVIASNTVSGIALTNTATTAGYAIGISVGNGTDPQIYKNTIFNITNARTSTGVTAPGAAVGIMIRSATNGASVFNNMISLGNGAAANTAFVGINANHGETPNPVNGDFIYHNTINIEGAAATGAQPSFGFLRGDFSTTSRNILIDFKNNLITNSRTGGTGTHYAIANNYSIAAGSSSVGWAGNASNYNVLNANPAAIGWWSSAQTLAGWKTASAGDVYSQSGITVTYVNSANDLHLNMGATPTPIESGALLINGLVTDYDGEARPGPLASVNGGALSPDIGADEIDGAPLDNLAPSIFYSNLVGTCTTADRTFTATITDATGVPTTGALVPTVYFRKNAGTYVSSPGVLVSGNGSNGVWSFTISSSAMGGISLNDVVSYFVIAQDNTPHVVSLPAAGLVATNVNAVTTPPTVPNFYLVSALSGTYNVGAAGTFTSLTQAAFVYNNSCLAGPVTFMLTDVLYSTSEVFPIVFLNNTTASSTNSLLIRPATGVVSTITGNSSLTLIGFNGADYITLDGSNNGSASKDLTLSNTSTSSLSSVVFIGNSSITDAASNIAISQCIINGNGGNITYGGLVVSSGIVAGLAAETPNNNITISRNTFAKSYYGIFAYGNALTPDQNWNFTSNVFGSATPADKIGYRAINIQNATQLTISSNTIAGISSTIVTNPPAGIVIASAVSNATLSRNIISDVKNTNTTNASGASGILLSSTSGSILVSNNMISDVAGYGGTLTALGSNGNGMTISGGVGYRIYHNSILLNTNQVNTATTSRQAALHITSGMGAGSLDIRNNIFVVTQTTGMRYVIQSLSASNGIFSDLDNNLYSTTGGTLGFISSARLTLADIQTGFGSNLNSTTVSPVFVSGSDLHLVPASNAGIDDTGTPIAEVPIDIDSQVRSTLVPDIGADEFTGSGCVSVNAGTIAASSYTLCIGQSTLLTNTGASTGSGITRRWKVSSTPGGPYTDVFSGTGFTTPNLNEIFPTSGTYYYVLATSCAAASSTLVSNEATVTVNAAPSVSISSTHSLVCPSTSVILTASGADTYLWSVATATTTTVQVVPTGNAVYTFTGTSLGCSKTATFGVQFSANPVITAASASMMICAGGQATLVAFGANTYTWNDGANVINGTTINPTPSITTNYTVVGSNSVGCTSAPITQSINVNAPILSVSGSTAVCPGESTTLTASGATSYTWNTGVNTASLADTPPTNTSYTVSGTNNFGCTAAFVQAVSVGNVSVTITGPAGICAGKSITLTANGASTYTWNDGSNSPTLIVTPTTSETYSVFGISGNCSNSASLSLAYNPNPTVSVSGNATICVGETTTLTASGATTYSWNTASTTTAIMVSPATNTVYNVTGTSAFGCSTSTNYAVVSNTVPVITVAASGTAVCATFPVTYTASGGSTYTWNATGPNTNTFTVIPTANTTYTVVGRSSANCSASKTIAIVTNTLPVVVVAPASVSVCVGTPTTFAVSGAATYTWNGTLQSASVTFTPLVNATHTVVGTSPEGCTTSVTVGVVANPIPTVFINPASATACAQAPVGFTASGASTYIWDGFIPGASTNFGQINNTTHTVVGISPFGCSSSATVSVTTLPLPAVTIAPGFTTVCVGSTVNFTATGATTYSWFNTSTSSVVALSPTIATSYSVVGIGANGCRKDASAIVLTSALPVLSVTPASATICATTPVNLTASGALTYTWSNAAGTGSAISVTPMTNTTYTVEGTDLAGCIGSKTLSIVSNSLPVVSISPTNPAICLNSAVTLTASGATTYSWSTASTGSLITLAPATSSVYTVTGKTSAGCSGSKTIALTVNPLPNIVISPAVTTTICIGETITFSASGAATYTWLPSNLVASTFTDAPKTTAYYSINATDANGCEDSEQLAVLVNGCTGIDEASLTNSFKVYPNPSAGTFNVDLETPATIFVYDLLGSVVYSDTLDSGKQTVNLSDKAKGVYLMNVIIGTKHQTLRLIIE